MLTAQSSVTGLPPERLVNLLTSVGQDHVLSTWERLTQSKRRAFVEQLESIDWEQVPGLVSKYVTSKPAESGLGDISPPAAYSAHGSWDRTKYRALGVELIKRGKVAAFTVAGGQGTRLGYDGPKGCYPAGSVTQRSLFSCLAQWILAAQNRFCDSTTTIPWYIMTSPLNHESTRTFFKEQGFFGMREKDVMFFNQGVMPSFDMRSGKVLLDQPGVLAVNPDGHGGSIKALKDSGALADMQSRGITELSYTQIDNPLVRVIDPVFLGLHAHAPDSSRQMSSKMVAKAHSGEKVGVLCKVRGKTSVVEYSDMPPALTTATNADGLLTFSAGNIAVHVISVDFLDQLSRGAAGGGLPYHRAEKKVPFFDVAAGKRIDPTEVNAVKLELFVFDALPIAEKSIVLETLRVEEFAPIKNASGTDSPESCSMLQTKRAAQWLIASGHKVPMTSDGNPDCTLELSPLTAFDAAELKAMTLPPIEPGTRLAI